MKPKKNSIIIRSDPEFYKAIKQVQLGRINMGKDSISKPMKTSKITLGITKHKLFPKLMEDLIKEWK